MFALHDDRHALMQADAEGDVSLAVLDVRLSTVGDLFGGPSRVLDVGAKQRLFTGATRTAVQRRDQECFEGLCDLPAELCQVDHIEPWSAGGATVVANGRVACGYHNRRRHRPPERPPP